MLLCYCDTTLVIQTQKLIVEQTLRRTKVSNELCLYVKSVNTIRQQFKVIFKNLLQLLIYTSSKSFFDCKYYAPS